MIVRQHNIISVLLTEINVVVWLTTRDWWNYDFYYEEVIM